MDIDWMIVLGSRNVFRDAPGQRRVL